MKTAACPSCPFRANSKLGYDIDAQEALEDGLVPSCHALVGLDNVFRAFNPTWERCAGFDEWCRGAKGFCEPKKAEA